MANNFYGAIGDAASQEASDLGEKFRRFGSAIMSALPGGKPQRPIYLGGKNEMVENPFAPQQIQVPVIPEPPLGAVVNGGQVQSILPQQMVPDPRLQPPSQVTPPKPDQQPPQPQKIQPAIPPQSSNPYSLNAAALPEVPTVGDQGVVAPVMDTKFSQGEMLQQGSFGRLPVGRNPEDSFAKETTNTAIGTPNQQRGFDQWIGKAMDKGNFAELQAQRAALVRDGYQEVNNLQSAPGDYEGTPFYRKTTDITAEQLQKSDPARYRALMELQALREADAAGQAKQYQQTGLTPPPIVRKGNLNEPITTIMQPNAPVTGKSLDPNAPKPFDMNNMEEYKVEIPGKGWMTGIRQKDPNRQQGTLSVAPGLSDGERQQVAQIESNQARQAAYGVSRKTGELYDAAQQHQQQQAALAALKQLQMQQEQAYQNKQLSLDERKALAAENQNAMTNEYNAGRLMVDRARLLQPNIKAPPIPTTSGIVDSVYKRTGGLLPKDMTRQKLIDEELRGSYGLGLDDEQSKPEFFQSTDPRFSGMVMHRRADGSITPISPDVYLLDLYQKQYGHLRGGDTPQPVGQ